MVYNYKNSSRTLKLKLKLGVPRRRQWHPTPVLLPGKSHGWRSLVGCSPWGRKQSDTTEGLHFHISFSCIGEGNGNPLLCSCLEIPRDGGAWWAAVYGVVQSRTRLKRLSMHACMHAPSKPSSILAWSPACFTYLLPFTSTIPHFYFLSHRHSPKCV